MKVPHTTRLAAETLSGPGRGPLQPSNGHEAPPAEPWGASPNERKYGVPQAELGARVAIALDEEDPRWGTTLDLYAVIVARAYAAQVAAWKARAA
jgi:hypothetical protein